jgi:hypothetical protein
MAENYQVIEPPATIRFLSFAGDLQGCGFIRVIYPSLLLAHYRNKHQYKVEGTYLTSFINDSNFYKNFTFVQFQRSATEQHLKLFNHYIKNVRPIVKAPIIYEIDDLLKDIPEWNYASSYYNNNTSPIFEMMKIVDGMTVSTEYLKGVYSEFCKNIVVIPNHLPKFIWGDVTPKHENNPRELKDKPRIGWAGSENHFAHPLTPEYKRGIRGGDFGEELLKFIRKTTDIYQWVLSGACPVELNDVKDKIEFHKWVSILDYPKHVRSLDLDIFMAPLMPCNFNNSKSNIKCLEAVAIGVPGVYSNAEPYKNMSLTSENDCGIIENIEKLANDIDFRKQVWERDYGIVRDQLYWEDNDNLGKYVNSYMSLFKRRLRD